MSSAYAWGLVVHHIRSCTFYVLYLSGLSMPYATVCANCGSCKLHRHSRRPMDFRMIIIDDYEVGLVFSITRESIENK